MEKVIEVQNLRKSYKLAKGKEMEAVRGTSFEVFEGEIFGILGPNGAGKTTTLEILECLKPQTSGTVAILGFDNLQFPQEIKERIGVQLQSSQYMHHLSLGELLDLFKSFYPQNQTTPEFFVSRTPSENEKYPGSGEKHSSGSRIFSAGDENADATENSGMDTKMELLKLVELEDKINEEFASLSGGQKQRFAIAVSLVNEPDILFLDEPTTGLDPKARRDLWSLIKDINARGITIILTTHYMEEAEFLCHRVAIMDQGKILEIDEPKKLIDRISETTQISFFTDDHICEKLFAHVPEVKRIHAAYPKVIIETSSLDPISTVVNVLKQHNITFYGFTVKTATLEDVYLRLTGKEYEE